MKLNNLIMASAILLNNGINVNDYNYSFNGEIYDNQSIVFYDYFEERNLGGIGEHFGLEFSTGWWIEDVPWYDGEKSGQLVCFLDGPSIMDFPNKILTTNELIDLYDNIGGDFVYSINWGDYNSSTDSLSTYVTLSVRDLDVCYDTIVLEELSDVVDVNVLTNYINNSGHLSEFYLDSSPLQEIISDVGYTIYPTGNITSSIFETIGDVVGGYSETISSTFDGLMGIFYDSQTNTLRPITTLLLIPVGMGIVLFAYYTIKRLL